MKWALDYQLFLFDFDGLLVDTERLHHQAYINMCQQRGFCLEWSFSRYSQAAHHKSTDLRDQIYAEFPHLHEQEPNWDVLYAEKKKCFLDLVDNQQVPLLPGVEDLLLFLQEKEIARCVVTHSGAALIHRIRGQNPVLQSIPHWLTREDYVHPKPDPQCYQIAISKWARPGDRIIGFEDSPRGLHALLGTAAEAVLICPSDSSYVQALLKKHPKVRYYPSFSSMRTDILL